MPFVMLKLKAGVNSELTPSLNEAGYSQSNLIRYRNGLAEKLGGWTRYYPFAVGGVPKALHAWLDLNENEYLGVGTTTLLGAITGGNLLAISPQEFVSNFNEDFDTTNTSPNVVVDDPNIANVTTFDSVEFLTPVSVGGIILSGLYPIDISLGTTTYRIVAATNATSTVASGGAVPSFATTSGSQIVTVTFANHGLSVGGKINLPISTTVGGVTLLGTYTALTVPGANSFTISASTLATSTTSASMNSGLARIRYHIALGPAATSTGYSVGGYSTGGYSTGTAVTAQTGTPIVSTDWTLDNWGEILLACTDGGGIYQWRPGAGFQNAQLLSADGAPAYNTGAFVSMQTQMLISYGSSDELSLSALGGIGLDQDPLLVKWSAQGDYTSFTPATTSQAGSRRLSTGSKIVGGMSVAQQELLWTDLGLWAMTYLGSLAAGVWGFQQIGWNCGLIGKHAMARLGSKVIWASQSNFYVLSGSGVEVLPCSVWDTIFQDLNTTYQYKSVAWANSPFNEFWLFYPRASTGATEPDAYVKVNLLEGVWDYGTLDRSAAIDQSILGMPIAATPTGIVYEHETSPDADGQPLNATFTTGLFQLSEGQDMMMADWLLPDMKWETAEGGTPASIQMTFRAYNYPNSTPNVYTPLTLMNTDDYKNLRVRGRLISIEVESNDLGSWWRFGGPRVRVAPDGRL